MRVPGWVKLAAVVGLLIATVVTIWYGVVYFVFGIGWSRLGGMALIGCGIFLFIKTLDFSLGRPPQFSNRPWERPWEDD